MSKLFIYRKIAIIGTARSGKTVFLTSLINHLEEHHRNDFIIGQGKGALITKFERMVRDKEFGEAENFNYDSYRDALVYKGEWPQKTRDTSHFLCRFKRSDWNYFGNGLHFFDFPGERLADASIARYEDYIDWSDYIINCFNTDTSYRQLTDEYLNFLKKGSQERVNRDEVLDLYRSALAKIVTNCRPMVTPSTFLLDQQGKTPTSKTKEDFYIEAKDRLLGLSNDQQFAPLPEAVRYKSKTLTAQFSDHYKRYRDTIVKPLFDSLNSSKRLIVLIDIPSLLNGGVSMYNDNREILENLFTIIDPESWLWRMLDEKTTQIDRVAFVATKSDSVHPIDVNEKRLIGLLREMTNKFANNLEDIDVEWFTCSAVVSAKPANGDYQMRGSLITINKSTEDQFFEVSKLPDAWPSDWNPGEYQFPTVFPKVPANKGLAPEQHGLDKIFTFIARD